MNYFWYNIPAKYECNNEIYEYKQWGVQYSEAVPATLDTVVFRRVFDTMFQGQSCPFAVNMCCELIHYHPISFYLCLIVSSTLDYFMAN